MTRTWLRSGTLVVAMSVAAASAYAQDTQGQGGTPRNSAPQRDQSSGGSNGKQFAQKMLLANMAEIQLGQLGVDHASSPEVKSFAQMMVTDHTQANQELLPLAQQLGAQQPTELDAKHRAIATRLSKLRGADFDKQFMKAMVEAHQDVVKQTTPLARNHGGSSATAGTSGSMAGSGAGATGTTGTMAGSGSGSTTGSGSGSTTGSGSSSTTGSGSGSSGSTTGSGASVSGSTGGTMGGDMSMGAQAGGASGPAPTTIAEYAAKTLPIVQQHLAQAQQLQKTAGR